MDNHTNLSTSIIEKANELNKRTFLFGENSCLVTDFKDKDLIKSKIKASKRSYLIFLILSIFCGGIIYVSGFAQVFELKLLDLSKAGLLIILTFGIIVQAWNHKINNDRLKMILFLIELNEKVENK